MREFIGRCCEQVLSGVELGVEEGVRLMADVGRDELMDLLAAADRIRRRFVGDEVHLCSIVNAKSGRCTEDCSFCSQSARFSTGVEEYALIDEKQVLEAARVAESNSAEALGLVAAWRGLRKGQELDRVTALIRRLSEDGRVHADASLGLIDDPEVATALKQAGLHTYNHNLETAASHFDNVCETHSHDDRLRTIELVREAGMNVCSGGILGMGESPRQRVELAAELREVDPDIVPLNFLNPIEGTPARRDVRTPRPARSPQVHRGVPVHVAAPPHHGGGRARGGARRAGRRSCTWRAASATMVGDYLTTGGNPARGRPGAHRPDGPGAPPRGGSAGLPPAPCRRRHGDPGRCAAAPGLTPWPGTASGCPCRPSPGQAGRVSCVRRNASGAVASGCTAGRRCPSRPATTWVWRATRGWRLRRPARLTRRARAAARPGCWRGTTPPSRLWSTSWRAPSSSRRPSSFPPATWRTSGVATALAERGDLILSDGLSHASTVDACRLSRAEVRVLPHSDVEGLRHELRDASSYRRVLVLVEGLYSMDGDMAPLEAMAEAARQAGAMLIIDDAHGLGTVGPEGRGAAAACGVSEEVAIQVGNLGKALGSFGAFVLTDERTRELLVQTSRSFIFTCSLPPPVVAAAPGGPGGARGRAGARRAPASERGPPAGAAGGGRPGGTPWGVAHRSRAGGGRRPAP